MISRTPVLLLLASKITILTTESQRHSRSYTWTRAQEL